MRRKPYPLNVLARANAILSVWEKIGTSTVLANTNQRGFTNEIAQVQSIDAQIREAESRLVLLRSQRDAAYVSLWDKVKRICSFIKGSYGDDSIEYELAGGTPLSKRKRPIRRAARTVTANESGEMQSASAVR